MAFLDQTGLQKVFTKLKALIDKKADASSIGNGTITITQAGSTRGSFTVNQSGNTTISLTDTNTDTNTWQANTVAQNGYVTAPTTSNANKVWKTDASGNPGWRDDANTTALGSMSGTLAVAHGGTGATAKGSTLLSNIGITTGTAAPSATGTAGTIYIQYS